MSPEQARGKPLDKRTDVWAFGCVLFEMLTGRKAFAGDDVSEILAFVITKEPDWAALPANAPGAIRKLLRRCLEKDRKRRLADVADARFELEEARHGPHAPLVPATSASPPSRRREYLWAVAALVFVITSGVLAVRSVFTPVPEAATVRFDVSAPEGARIDRTSTSISPDGRKVSYVATFESRTLIWVRRLDTSTAQPLPGTENASRPFWSPDSQFLAFFAQGKLKRIAATGGPIQVVCGLSGTATYNGTWNSRGVILFAANDQGPILRVSAAGGQSTPATVLNASLKENRHSYPNFLPDGRHFLYLSSGDVRLTYVGTLDSGERHALPGIVSEAKYSSMGYLMFLQNGSLVARRFDVGRLELSEEPLQIAEQFGAGPLAPFSVSMNGDIAHLSLGAATSQLAWFDRAGKQLALVGPAGEYRNPELSPDGRFVAFERGAPADIWVLDIQKGLTSRFTSNAAADTSPVWSPDGRTIAFATDRDTQVNIGQGNIYERAFGVVGEDKLLLKTDAPKNPMDWSRDGRHLVFDAGLDVWALPLTDDRKPFRVTETPSTEMQARMSTDGRWIAYASTESGRFEVYIQSFPRPGIKQQVSTMGGEAPRWKRDGSELFYLAPDSTLMAAAITPAGSSLEMGTPRPLFQSGLGFFTAVDPRNRAQYDVDHDGRFLMGVTSAEQSMRITVILNWMGR
jgi:Tol biopolymer transport system component